MRSGDRGEPLDAGRDVGSRRPRLAVRRCAVSSELLLWLLVGSRRRVAIPDTVLLVISRPGA